MTTLVVVPVLRRPHRVEPLLESLAGATPEPHRVLFCCTIGDEAEIAAVEATGSEHIDLEHAPGDYARKINTAVAQSGEPFVFLGADDLQFHPGWLSAALTLMHARVGVVGTNDLTNRRVMRGEHATHSLVARWYIDRLGTLNEHGGNNPGEVLFEGYQHEYVDDELVGTAKKRGAWAFAEDSHVEHLHPMRGKAPMDEIYAAQEARMRASRQLFQRRRSLWT